MYRRFIKLVFMIVLIVPASGWSAPAAGTETAEAQRFASPEEAAKALIEATRANDMNRLTAIFGGNSDLLSSGDAVADKNVRDAFVALADQKVGFEKSGDRQTILQVGPENWPFPIPIVSDGGGWMFDAEQGKEEIINSRIGRNELSVLEVMTTYVEAQAEYANVDRNGNGVSEYEQKIRSTPGQFDGLFWEASAAGPSPLGPLVAEARGEGYSVEQSDKPTPYHGYYYRILTRQGSEAPGGKYDYIINGNMIAGFGLVAFPAEYGSSGIMSFIVNHQGKIHEKDLGPETASIAGAMEEYNPDSTWELVDTGTQD